MKKSRGQKHFVTRSGVAVDRSVYYDPQWTALVKAFRERYGMTCCGKEHDHKYPHTNLNYVELDHIIEVQDGGAKFDPNNLIQLCKRCHSKKTHDAMKARRLKEWRESQP